MQDDPITSFDPNKSPHANSAAGITAAAALGNQQTWPPPSVDQLNQPAQQQAAAAQASAALAPAPYLSQRQGEAQSAIPTITRATASWSSWLGQASAAATEALRQAAAAAATRPPKQARSNEGKAAPPDLGGVAPATSTFVQEVVAAGLQAAMTSMSDTFDARFRTLEQDVQAVSKHQQIIIQNVTAVQHQAATRTELHQVAAQVEVLNKAEATRNQDFENLRQESLQTLADMKALQTKLNESASSVAPPPGLSAARGPPSSSSSKSNSTPHELRTEGLMAGLGDGLTEDQIIAKAREVLNSAQINPAWYSGISTNRRNTVAFIYFVEPGALKLTASKVRAANLFGNTNKRIWVDARRTREENRPARTVHKTAEGLADLHSTIEAAGGTAPYQAATLFKDMRRYQIRDKDDKGELIAFFNARRSEVEFSAAAVQKYSLLNRKEDLDQIAAWAGLE